MKQKSILILTIISFTITCAQSADKTNKAQKALHGSRPNIVLILTDDQGMGDLSCMGNKILRTPHVDQLYKDATRFTDFQVSPTCSPTRAAMMSGRYPFEVGVSHTLMQRDRLAPSVITFPQALQRAGYQTGLFGKWHLGDGDEYLPRKRGFDEVLMHGAGGIGQYGFGDFKENSNNKYFDNVLLHNETVVKTKGFCTDLFFHAALSWMKNQYEREKPFFAYLSLNAPHGPLIAPDQYKKRFLDYKIEVLHVTEKAIDQDFYNGLLADRPSNDELLDIYNENILDYDQPELRYLKYVKWPIMSNATDSLRVKLEAEDLIFRLNEGEDFALLANTYTEDPNNSADPQNLKGGDLGWFNKGQLLPEFEIASFEAEKGSIVGPILTQYGYHLIKVNDKRTVESNEQVNASHILLTIQPGRGTENELKDTASIFALEATEYGFFALADSLGLEIQDSNGLRKESIFVDNFGVGRSAVNFAFNNVEGSTSDAIKNDNFFGVFFLDKVDKETVIPFEEVKEDLRNEFLSEFKKNHLKTLAESIKDNNQEEMNLSAIYKNNENLEYVAETNSALIGSFESIGKSNFIVGALADAKEGDILGPLPTLRGQAFLRVIEISEVVNSDFEEKKESIKFSLLIDRQNAIWGNWLQALRDNADLKDYRYDFY